MGPDLQHFMELCAQAGIELPARIDDDIAAEISNAYAHHREIEPLVRKHRIASLLGGSGSLRLEILRQLVEKDAASTLWKSELRTAAGLRIREIGAAAREAEEQPRRCHSRSTERRVVAEPTPRASVGLDL